MNNRLSKTMNYAYIKRLKRWMECPVCQERMLFSKEISSWVCASCGYSITENDFLDDFVFWFCDGCGDYLNVQPRFDRKGERWVCTKCGFDNDISAANIKGQCKDCGILLDNPDATICPDCKIARLETAQTILEVTAAACHSLADACQTDTEDVQDSVYDPFLYESEDYSDTSEEERNIPVSLHNCDICGKPMKRTAKCEFYCPDCDITIFDFSFQYEV